MTPWRSLLFVPANDEKRLSRCHERGADAIILDLEDGVPRAARPAARETMPALIADLQGRGCELVLRVNTAWLDIVADLAAGVHGGLTAVMVPKVEDPAALAVISAMIGEWEVARGLEPCSVGLIALVETARGLAALDAIADLPRVVAIALGTEDFALSLGVAPTPDLLDLPCRNVALAASRRSLMALAVPYSISEFRDEPAFRDAAVRARSLGASGALCIHPVQVTIANLAFAPNDLEIAEARATVEAWAEAQRDGVAVASRDGRMIDRPVVERARRLLARL